MTTPFNIGGATNPTFGYPAQHGSSEQHAGTATGVGGTFGMTPPASPRRSLSPRTGSRRSFSPRAARDEEDGNRDREREARRRPPQDNRDDDQQPLPEQWGARMLATETRIRELAAAIDSMKTVIEGVNSRADTKIEQMKGFVQEVEGRFNQLERSIPERIHILESKSENFVAMVNGLAGQIQSRFEEIESVLRARSVPPMPPSFGGTAGPSGNTQFCGIGSPLSGPEPKPDPWFEFAQSRSAYSSGPPAAPAGFGMNSAPRAPVVAQVLVPPVGAVRPFDLREWNAVDIKVAKELKPFNGSHGAYKIWANRVKDHFRKKNNCWGHLFNEIEGHKLPICKQHLVMRSFNVDGCLFEVDLSWASNALWTFIGEHVVDTVYTNRGILSGGCENGLELWRGLYLKHEGGADQVELGGMGSLHSFPQCDKVENLQLWVGKWQEIKDMYGKGISEPHLKSMFLNMLPPNVQREIREKPTLITLQDCINHVLSDLGRLNDAQLSKMHMERLKSSLSSSQRLSPVLDLEEKVESSAASSDPPKPEPQLHSVVNALSQKMEAMIAAIARPKARPQARTSDRGPSLFAKFGDRCLHCGSEKHRAKDCPVKKSILEKHGGKFPEDYESAFDKWKKKQPKKVAAVLGDEDDYEFDEFEETDLSVPLWCVSACAVTAKNNFEHANPFAPIFDDDDDDEDKVIEALKHISSNVKIGPKISQKQKRSAPPANLDRKRISHLARLVRSGDLGLPDLDLQSDDQYEAVWALVDSGAARSCARRRAHFLHTETHLRPSHVKMATASGEELASRGCFSLDAFSAEGNQITQTFEDADVDMPIMSVGELAANGEMGSNVLFGERDGHMIDIKTNATSKFYRRRGVYFMKLYVRKDRRDEPDFARPGHA